MKEQEIKQKAKELVEWYDNELFDLNDKWYSIDRIKSVKRCAIKCCEESIKQLSSEYNNDMGSREKDTYILKRIKDIESVIEEIKHSN